MCFEKENYKEFNYHDEKMLNWILEHGGSILSEQEIHGMSHFCDECKIEKGEDDNYYFVDSEGNITDEEYIVTVYYSPDFEELIDEGEISVSTDEERATLLDLGNIIIFQCNHCFQWGFDCGNH
ncbi:hypothetical protein OCD85_27375 [Bacillus pacificus]|uniref:hypothetical protein n=1 Tax=Bacillus pacificus TaxID=2026187 RepID=UPI0021CD6AA8|nr:hypothetical protein [Bacillus pacificus]MCU5364634.1 hypothetical protein [Bacillus pacificus]MCU5402886.1 hypothetical protein [Bacillus pacificus]